MASEFFKKKARTVASGSGGASDHAQGAEILTAAKTLDWYDDDKTFYLNSASEFAVTLPTPKLGFRCRFVVKASPVGTSYTVVTKDGDNIIYGGAASYAAVTPAGAPASAEDTITFVAGTSIIGDSVELWSDGTNWYVQGFMSANGGITFAAT